MASAIRLCIGTSSDDCLVLQFTSTNRDSNDLSRVILAATGVLVGRPPILSAPSDDLCEGPAERGQESRLHVRRRDRDAPAGQVFGSRRIPHDDALESEVRCRPDGRVDAHVVLLSLSPATEPSSAPSLDNNRNPATVRV